MGAKEGWTMLSEQIRSTARPGDWVRIRATAHTAPREGRIVDVIGPPGHECFRVRWEDDVESIFFPSDGDRLMQRYPHAGNRDG
jgi:hypothetical protein